MNGVLVVDKPAGPTSHDVVSRVRRAVGLSRIGHTGTLDPLATGVLALVVGRATRLAQFLSSDEKEYLAGVRFGQATPTYDAEERMLRDVTGTPVGLAEPASIVPMAVSRIAEVLPEFSGTYLQMPPPFSAKKIGGTRAYLLARTHKQVEMRPAQVSVRTLELVGCCDGLATLRVVCSSGFYVRSLAHELGQRLGCGAHLESLRRLRAGAFDIAQSVPLAALEERPAEALRALVPLPHLLDRLPEVVVTGRGAKRTAHGNSLAPGDLVTPVPAGEPAGSATPVRIVDGDGALIAIAEHRVDGLLHPIVVLV